MSSTFEESLLKEIWQQNNSPFSMRLEVTALNLNRFRFTPPAIVLQINIFSISRSCPLRLFQKHPIEYI